MARQVTSTIGGALLAVMLAAGAAAAQDQVEDSIVKVFSTTNPYNYSMPWQKLGQRNGTGSGVVIAGNRILTNAHVVEDYTYIEVKRANSPDKVRAEVEFVGHDCDLALLKVADEAFFRNTRAIPLGGDPQKRDRVRVYGFPAGGESLSVTEGVVSRIETSPYEQSGERLLAVQIDAAVNPGNSGGPVLSNDQLAGIAFQGIGALQNTNYAIPVQIIRRFLADVADGSYDGIPQDGLDVQPMGNRALREKYRMADGQTGVLVYAMSPLMEARNLFRRGDVLLDIDGRKIANDGMIELDDGTKVFCGHLLDIRQKNDALRVKLLREGRVETKEVRLQNVAGQHALVPRRSFDRQPTYYINAGLVFIPLTGQYLETFGGHKWKQYAPENLVYYNEFGRMTGARRQVIVLSNILRDEVNSDYTMTNLVVSRVNGREVADMRGLIRAFDGNRDRYHTIDFEEGPLLVIDRLETEKRNRIILERNNVPADRSPDLR